MMNMRRITRLLLPVLFAALWIIPLRAQAQAYDSQCLRCHGNPELSKTTGDGKTVSLYVKNELLKTSAHRKLSCVECHSDLARETEYPHVLTPKPVECSSCHTAVGQEVAVSSHWHLTQTDPAGTLNCASCHSAHDVQPAAGSDSPTNRRNISKICLGCHADQEVVPGKGVKVSAYERSIHGMEAFVKGDTTAAICTDCHGNHKVLPAKNPASPVYKFSQPQTCGGCHTEPYAQYRQSIHGQAMEKGILDAPVCTDCHGEHTILAPDSVRSSVSPAHVPETCGRCHENVVLTEKYGIASERFSTYQSSYHGVANQYGRTVVANCASCHGYHAILPPTDPTSTIHPANLAGTCGKCHPNAGENFAKGKMHVQATLQNSPGVFFVRRFYYLFIGGLMGLFILYMILDYTGFIRRKGSRRNK
jgi:hypothetical protein